MIFITMRIQQKFCLFSSISLLIGITRAEEYCITDRFSPQCSNEEVIVMEKALYGRMNIGKCVQKDYGVIGCKEDLLRDLDGKCSGLMKCAVYVGDFDMYNPCNDNELRTYLDAIYTCVRVHVPPRHQCHQAETEIMVTEKLTHLSLINGHCGGSKLLLQAQPGQKVEYGSVK